MNYNESISGEITNDPNNPLALSLSEGINTITASVGGGDQDYITITIPDGFQLDSITLVNYSQPGDVAFIGVQQGAIFTEPLDNSANTNNFLGFSLFGSNSDIGQDILPSIGSDGQGFTGSLASGVYTFAIQQLGSATDYQLDFNVTQAVVPPPLVSLEVFTDSPQGSNFAVEDDGIGDNDTGSAVTFRVNLDNPAPAEALRVYIDSEVEQILNRFDLRVPSLLSAPVENINLNSIDTNLDNSGLAFTIDAGATFASFTLNTFNNDEPDTFLPETFDGLVEAEFSLKTADQVDPVDQDVITGLSPFTPNPNATSSTITFIDDPSQIPMNQPIPVVSFEALPATISEEGNAQERLLRLVFTVEGEIPEGGLVVNFDNLFGITDQLDSQDDRAAFNNLGFAGFDIPNSRIFVRLDANEASIDLPIINDILEETTTFNFILAEGEGYAVDPDKNSTVFTITDDNGGPGVGPTIGLSVSDTNLVEGDSFTVNFTVVGDIPAEGVDVIVQSSVAAALGQFDLANLATLQLSGVSNLRPGDDRGVSFIATITEPNASITLDVFDDIIAEDDLEIPFTLLNGELYEVDPNAETVTLNITDETQPAGPTVGLSVDRTTLVEGGDGFTLTISVDGAIPPEGLPVLINDTASASSRARSITEFDIASIQFTGLAGFPTPAEGDSGFFVTITEPTATLTLTAFDDGADEVEEMEAFTFAVIDGEAYEVDADNREVTLNIIDVGDAPVLNVESGVTSVFLDLPLLEAAAGLTLVGVDSDGTAFSNDFQVGFDIKSETDFSFLSTDLAPVGGSIEHEGTITLALGDAQVTIGEFSIRFDASRVSATTSGFFIADTLDDALGLEVLFDIGLPDTATVVNNELDLGNADLLIAPELANALGLPELTGADVGNARVDALVMPELPIVSFSTTSGTLSEEDGSLLVLNFSVNGDIPDDGITVNLEGDMAEILQQFLAPDGDGAVQTRVTSSSNILYRFDTSFGPGAGLVGGTLDVFSLEDGDPAENNSDPEAAGTGFLSNFSFTITEQNASITLPVSDDLIQEMDQTFTYNLVSGDGYVVDPNANSGTFTVTDGITPAVSPIVSVEATPSDLIESQQTVIELTFTTEGDIPAEGLVVQLQGPPRSIAEFDINATNPRLPEAETVVEGLQVTGGSIVGTDEVAGSLLFRITDATSTISVPVFDDGPNEGQEDFTFTLLDGEAYEVNGDSSEVSITIQDGGENAIYNTESGVTSVFLDLPLLETAAGLTLVGVDSDGVPASDDFQVGFNITEATDFSFAPVPFTPLGGTIEHDGTITLALGDAQVTIGEFSIGFDPARVSDTASGFFVADTLDDALGLEVLFDIGNPDAINLASEDLDLGDADLLLAPELATALGLPDLAGADVGDARVDAIVEVFVPPVPIVNFSTDINTLIESEGSIVTFNFDVQGVIPEEGLPVSLQIDAEQLEWFFEFDNNSRPRTNADTGSFDSVLILGDNSTGIEGGRLIGTLLPPDFSTLELVLTENIASFEFEVFDDVFAEANEDITFTLLGGNGYEVGEGSTPIVLTIQDSPDGTVDATTPVVALSVDQTTIAEGDVLTVTFNVTGDIPAEGLPVFVDSDRSGVLGEFNPDELSFTGLAFPPGPDTDAGGFVAIISENTATISLPIIKDGLGEGSESFTFNIVDGEAYEPDPTASEVTLTIEETPPVISVDLVGGVFDGTTLVTPSPVENPDVGDTVLSLVLQSDAPVPEDGLVVNINSDLADLTEFFEGSNFVPTSFGGEVLGAIYDADGNATGIQVRMTAFNTVVNFTEGLGLEGDRPHQVSFFVETGTDYIPSPDVAEITVYDTTAQVPAPTSIPEVAINIDEQRRPLSEGSGLITVDFTVNGDIPAEGVIVYVSTGERAGLGDFDLLNAGVTGGTFPPPDEQAGGFYFKITEPTASITLQAAVDEEVEGIEDVVVTLQPLPTYTIANGAGEAIALLRDGRGDEIQVTLSGSPDVLVEADGTVSVHTLTLSAAPPDEGITVIIQTPGLADFDLSGLAFEGISNIEVLESSPEQLAVTIVEQTATISLPVANDADNEGLEVVTFTLAEPAEDADYQVSPETNSAIFTIVETPDQVPPEPITDGRFDSLGDTIATATPTNLSNDNAFVTVEGSINGNFFDSSRTRTDNTEDVDMFAVDLQPGDVLRLDIDAQINSDESPDTVLRLFDVDGNELAQSDDDFAPDELFAPGRRDSYLEFTADTAGTYYVGVSSFGNGNFDFFIDDNGELENDPYDLNVAGSGAGRSDGVYTLNLSLNQEATASETEIPASTGEGPNVSISASVGTFDQDDNLISNALVQFTPEFRNASILTLGFSVDGEIPEEGIEAFITSDIDLSTIFSTRAPFSSEGVEVLGAVFDDTGSPVGIKVNLTINSGFVNLNLDDPDEAPTDGEQTVNFTLEPAAGYTVGEGTFSTIIYDTLADVPPAPIVPAVGISISETTLIESEGTLTTLTFTLDSPPPEGGVTVNVDSGIRAALGEFNVSDAEITGGTFPAPNFRASGFFFNITEQTATITLSAFDETTNPNIDPEDALEGIEELTFSIQPGVGYAITPNANSVTVSIADNPNSVPIIDDGGGDGGDDTPDGLVETEFNDTITDAIVTNFSPDQPVFEISGEIGTTRDTRNFVDRSEDVDMYAFELRGGQTVVFDLDAGGTGDAGVTGSLMDTILRVFDANGNEVAVNNNGGAPDEVFQANGDSYLEFTAPNTGVYYVGISNLGNDFYDPNVQASGSGWIFEDRFEPGPYRFTATLTNDVPPPVVSATVSPASLTEEDANTNIITTFTVDGEVPPVEFDADGNYLSGGLSILYQGPLVEILDELTGDVNLNNLEIGSFFDLAQGIFEVILFDNNATLELTILNDVIEEVDQEYTFNIIENESGSLNSIYTVDPNASTTTVTLSDGNGGPGVGPTIGLSISDDDIKESGEFTINFNVVGDIPPEGVTVLVDSPTMFALGEFNIFNDDGSPAFTTTGISGIPEIGDIGASSFLVTITDPSANITISAFDDGPNEGLESLTFDLINGEEYEVNPDASTVTLDINDGAEDAVFNVESGVTSVFLDLPVLEAAAGLTLVGVDTDGVAFSDDFQVGFNITPDTDFSFAPLPFTPIGGSIEHEGNITLGLGDAQVTIGDFSIGFDPARVSDTASGFFVADTLDDALGLEILFDLGAPEAVDVASGDLDLGNADLLLAPELANALGLPDLAGADVGDARVDAEVALELPVVSVTTPTPVVSEDGDTTLTVVFNVDGVIPEGGVPITVGGDLTSLFDPELRLLLEAPFVVEPPTGLIPIANRDPEFDIALTESVVSISFEVFNDILEEQPLELNFALLEGDGYVVDGDGIATVTIVDGDSVIPGSGPTVSLSVSETDLAEGGEFTVNFEVDGDIPAGGLTVFVDGPPAALSEFNIFGDDGIDPTTDLVGLAGLPAADNDAGGFFATITENQASITLSLFNDGPTEGLESLTFELINGEEYEVDPNASAVTLNINDGGEDAQFAVESGVTSVFLDFPLLEEAAGLTLVSADSDGVPAERLPFLDAFQVGFDITPETDFSFAPVPFTPIGGSIEHDGTITLALGDAQVTIGEFSIGFDPTRVSDTASGFFVADTLDDALGLETLFDIGLPDNAIVSNEDFDLGDADLLLAPELATALGLPDLAGADVGDARVDAIVDEIPSIPVVSFAITPPQVVEEDQDAAFTGRFTVEGDIPEVVFDADGNYESGGLSVFLDVKEVQELGIQFDEFIEDNLTFGPFSDPQQPGVFEFILFENTSSISLTIFNDIVREEPFTYNFELIEDQDGMDYVVNPDANTGSFELIDGNGGANFGPLVELSVNDTDLVEGDQLTVNFSLPGGNVPGGSLDVLVESSTPGALGEFALFDENGTPLFSTTGIEGVPVVGDAQGSSFIVTLTEPEASITLSVFDDGPGEGEENLTFTLADGELYRVSETNNSVDLTINDAPELPSIPVVSFSTTSGVLSEENGPALVLDFSVNGVIPTNGITVNLEGDTAEILQQFLAPDGDGAVQTRVTDDGNIFYRFDTSFEPGAGIVGGTLDVFSLEDGDPAEDNSDPDAAGTGFLSNFSFTITEANASITLPVSNDILQEMDQTFTYTLAQGEGYAVDPDANSGTFTVTDGITPADSPTVGVSATPDLLIESEQTVVELTFTTTGAIPQEGLVVQLQGPPRSIAEFDVNATNPRLPEAETVVEGVQVTGGNIVGTDEVAGSLLFRINSPTATVTVPVFDDDVDEGTENFTFTLLDGEEYEVDPANSSIDVTIEDESPVNPIVLDDTLTRFRNDNSAGSYLYVSETEAVGIRNNFSDVFTEEGEAFDVSLEPQDGLVKFNRFSNNNVNGSYIFADETESESIRDNFSDVFTEEGTAFYAYGADAGVGEDVFRFRNLNSNGYLFASGTEAQNIRDNLSNTFVEEGAAFEILV